ncbi:MAG TPA: Uma2 family endonuclease [Xanthobacteraceae bacterium]|nr:Uma2 family endonuclease [Xanthobacteraceae bacterium]
MNVAITRAAEGLPRRAFSVDDVRRMIDAGVLREDENFELIGGEVVMMAAKGFAHELVKNALTLAVARSLPATSTFGVENSLQLADDVLVEPDLAVILRAGFKPGPHRFIQPADIQLIMEISATSLSYDRGLKARLYARYGIREFWVIDANERTAWIHTGPSGEGWSSIVERGPNDSLATPALPGFSLRLGDIS